MAKKDFFCIIDTETTQTDKVADFAAIIMDRKGIIQAQCAVLISGIFDDPNNHPLFVDKNVPLDSIWSRNGQGKRYANYKAMLDTGTRMMASVNAVNRWLEKAIGRYDPYLTAYNLPFDGSKCENTNIDLTKFKARFCLWAAAYTKWANTKDYKNFVLNVHGFNSPTSLGNMTYKTNAELMARFIFNNPNMPDEPHTSLEDIIDYELPILVKILSGKKGKWWLTAESYNWRRCQVRDHYKAK